MVYSDGSLGVGFHLQGFDGSVASTESLNNLSVALETLLNTAGEELKLQFFYRMTSDVSDQLRIHRELAAEDPLYQPILDSRLSYLDDRASHHQFFRPEIHLFVRTSPFHYRKRKFWEKAHEYEQIAEKDYQEYRAKFVRIIAQIESSLHHANLHPKQIQRDKWLELIFDYLNHRRRENIGLPNFRTDQSSLLMDESISEQASLTDIEVFPSHIASSGRRFRVVTLKTLPEGQSQIGMVQSLCSLPFNFLIVQNLLVHDQKTEVEKLQLQRRLAHSMAAGSKNVSDLESESKLHHIEELIQELLEGSEKIISTDLNVIIWGDTEEELEERSDEVLKAYRGLNQGEGVVETLPGIDVFFGCAPGVCEGLRYKKVKTSNAAHLTPVFSYWLGNKRPVCLLPNRDGALVSIDPFAPELPNWNGMVIGGSGSGKSFSLLQMILQFYGQNPRPKVVWIDNGASSQRAIEVLDGQFIDLNIESDICLNVFDLEEGVSSPTPSKVKLILAVLETILKEDNQEGLPKRDKALLEEAIFSCYEKIKDRTPRLSDLRDYLKNHYSPVIKGYAEILFSWTGNTAYGRLLDGETNVALTKNLTTIEIKGLDCYPDLQNVFLLLFTDFIRKEASRDISQPFLFVIDEGWKIFQTPSALAFALEAYRTFRKFNAGIWCISQNYKDFLFNEEITAAILPNTTSIFILKQRGIDWDDFKKTLNLDDAELDAVKNIRVQKGKFTEVFFIQDDGRSILHIEPDQLSYWICTSDPMDKTKIAQLEAKEPTLSKIEILQKLGQPLREAA